MIICALIVRRITSGNSFFYGIRKFITVFTKACYWIHRSTKWI